MEPIPPEDKKAIEDVASYLVKAPLSLLKKLAYLDSQKAVVYRPKMNPALGRSFEAMDPLEWLARLADNIPDPGKHRTLTCGYYANRARGARAKKKAKLEGAPAEAPKKRRCSPNWARLISKVYHADPLTCRTCRGPLRIDAYIPDQLTIKTILDHLGLAPPEIELPPPQVRYVAVDHEGRELEAMVAEGVSAPKWGREEG